MYIDINNYKNGLVLLIHFFLSVIINKIIQNIEKIVIL